MIDDIRKQVANALAEDIGSGDITAAIVAADTTATAQIITREAGIICGVAYASESFKQVDSDLQCHWRVQDGDAVVANQLLCELSGKARSILTAERTALNFLQFLSGIASKTNQVVKQLAGTQTTLLDTRKTIPNLRFAQKYAIRCGGGQNHRFGLYDAFLIKENHIASAGSISKAIAAARGIDANKKLEIEVESLAELAEAIQSKPDIIMLDNFDPALLREAVALNQGQVKLEASGGININNIRDYALTGVDYISIGCLTKDVAALDLSLKIDKRAKLA